MARDEEVLRVMREYAQELASVRYDGDIHARYSHTAEDDIAQGIRQFHEQAGKLFAASKA